MRNPLEDKKSMWLGHLVRIEEDREMKSFERVEQLERIVEEDPGDVEHILSRERRIEMQLKTWLEIVKGGGILSRGN